MKGTRSAPYETPTDVQGLLDEFEWLGILCKTGEFRRGQPVYVVTEFGKKLGDVYSGEAEFNAAVRALIRRKLSAS